MIIPKQYNNKPVAVFGLGIDGKSTVRALLSAGAIVYCWDDNPKARHALGEMALPGLDNLMLMPPEAMDWNVIDTLVLSPGVPLTHPEPAPIVILAKQSNVRIICSLELLYETVKNCYFVGITGTNGKSTTTALIHHILSNSGIDCAIGGNFGIPVMDLSPLKMRGVYVIEMSSYQLDLLDRFQSDISILLNITPDHLDRHGGMEGYITAKKRIFRHLNEQCSAVIGIDNPITRKIYSELVDQARIGKIIPISAREQLDNGVSVIDNQCYFTMDHMNDFFSIGAVPTLAGEHNAENMAAAIASCTLLGVNELMIKNAIQTFKGLAHRMQYLGDIDHIMVINDSKATNADSAEKALKTYKNIYWIAGGVAKEGGIESLQPYFPNVKKAYLIGESQDNFAATMEGKLDYEKFSSLRKAYVTAYREALLDNQKAVLLLSPSAASFDQFANFEARGEAFITLYNDTID